MNHYRDPVAGLVGQITAKKAQLETRAGAVSPILRAVLPAAERVRLGALEQDVSALETADAELGVERLVAVDMKLDELLVAYDDVLARSDELRVCDDDELTDPAPSRTPRSVWLMEEGHLREIRAALRKRLRVLAPGVELVRYGDHAYAARFTHDEVLLSFVAISGPQVDPESPPPFTSYLRTTMPAGLDDLDVKPESILLTLARAVHLARELSFGHDAFDDAFWVTGSADAAKVLTREVRDALVELAPLEPHLTLGGGLATLSWRGSRGLLLRRPLSSDALDVMTALRRAIATG